jgi:predicted secreted acid phosphatase
MNSTGTIFSITGALLTTGLLGLLVSQQAALSCPCAEIKSAGGDRRDFTVSEGLAFKNSAVYKKEFETAIRDARRACQKHTGEKYLSIVSDIDETVLDNSSYFKEHKDGGWNEWRGWVVEARAPLLKPTADLLSWARKNGFAIFFITGRPENERKETVANLLRAGLAYDGLFMRPEGDKGSPSDMKTKYRKQIADMGFKTIVNLGDQYSDLTGGYSEDCEKLPNKLYFIP